MSGSFLEFHCLHWFLMIHNEMKLVKWLTNFCYLSFCNWWLQQNSMLCKFFPIECIIHVSILKFSHGDEEIHIIHIALDFTHPLHCLSALVLRTPHFVHFHCVTTDRSDFRFGVCFCWSKYWGSFPVVFNLKSSYCQMATPFPPLNC